MEFKRRTRRHSHNTIAPLVDVVFLLLLFFVLTFHIMPEQALNIDLPESSTADRQPEQGLVIAITPGGTVLVNEAEVPLAALAQRLESIHAHTPELPVEVRADEKVEVGLLVRVMDAVRQTGFDAFDLVTEPL